MLSEFLVCLIFFEFKKAKRSQMLLINWTKRLSSNLVCNHFLMIEQIGLQRC